MSVNHFLDSNVLIYMFDETNADKRQLSEQLIYQSIEHGTGCISYQVVQETINIAVRKLGATADDCHQLLENILFPLWQMRPTREFYQDGIDLRFRYKFSFYDSLIVAAALETGCITLYSEDLQDGQQVESLTIRNPFLE